MVAACLLEGGVDRAVSRRRFIVGMRHRRRLTGTHLRRGVEGESPVRDRNRGQQQGQAADAGEQIGMLVHGGSPIMDREHGVQRVAVQTASLTSRAPGIRCWDEKASAIFCCSATTSWVMGVTPKLSRSMAVRTTGKGSPVSDAR